MRVRALLPIALLVAGVGLLSAAVVAGGASLAIVLVVPVVAGRSLEFVLGVLLLVAGLFCLPLAFEPFEESPGPGGAPASEGSGAGGFVLIGPIPIFFGQWRSVSPRTRWAIAIVGGVALVAAVLVLAFAPR